MKEDASLVQFDLRTLEQQLRSGKITKKDYESFLKSLPDSESNAEYIEPVSEQAPAEASEESGILTFAPAES